MSDWRWPGSPRRTLCTANFCRYVAAQTFGRDRAKLRRGQSHDGHRESAVREADGSRALGYVPGLDGIRGVAVLLVVATHLVLEFVPDKTMIWVPGGFLGVEIFFVLSGFLITTLLLNEHSRNNRISFRRFYARRALRLLPALFAMLAAYLLYVAITKQDLGFAARSSVGAALYVTNWMMALGHNVSHPHLWSLAVEEQFYIVWPVVLATLLAVPICRRHLVGILTAIVALLTLWTLHLWATHTVNFFTVHRVYARTDVQAVPLLIGAIAGYCWTQDRFVSRAAQLLAGPSAILIGACVWRLYATSEFYYKGGLVLVSIASASAIVATVDGRWLLAPLLSFRPLRAIGRVSYGLYVWHLAIFIAVSREGHAWSTAARILTSLLLTAAFTVASWHLVERPFLRRKSSYRAHDTSEVPTKAMPSVSNPRGRLRRPNASARQ